MVEIESDAFSEALRQKAALDKFIIKSDADTHLYTDKEEIPNGNVIEIRPKYSNFTIPDVPTANLPDKESEEEIAMRLNAEYAMHLQEFGQRIFQDRLVDRNEFIRIKLDESTDKVLVFSGILKNQKILIKSENEKGEETMQPMLADNVPFFSIVETEKIQNIPIVESVQVKRIERHFMDLSGESKRINNNVMDRLGFTKARGMRGSAAIHEEHLKRTNIGTPTQQDIEMEKDKGFHI